MLEPSPTPMTEPDEELRDDAIIGQALGWSLKILALGVCIAGLAVAWNWFHRKTVQVHETQLVAPGLRDQPVEEVPAVRFTDVTRESGVDFVHTNGAYGEKLLPETMGSGCAFFDFDNDGYQDLLLVNSSVWPWRSAANPAPGQEAQPTLKLYHNDGKGHFRDVTAGSGLDVPMYAMGVAVGDYDNDGRVDVFISGVGGNRLFKNLGEGKFRDVTAEAGLAGDGGQWGTSCGFFDYDNDGKLDLFVCNYVRWSRETDRSQGFVLTGLGRAYGPPVSFEGTTCRLYHNEGNGRFRDVSKSAGIEVLNPATGKPMAKSLGVTFIDLDNDGYLDIIVANDTVQNFVFHNRGNGTFEEIGMQTGLAFDSSGQARGAMGIDAAWYRDDGSVGVAVSNFANEMTALYVSQGRPLLFADEAVACGIGPASRPDLKFGLFFFDYDLDGRLDLLTANGHLEADIQKVQASQQYRQSARLFWNAGSEQSTEFVCVGPDKCGTDLFHPIVGRGAAYADIDGDGDLDVILTQNGGSPLLLRNELNGRAHYLRFKLVGTLHNRDAIGAVVAVDLGDRVLHRQVMPTRSYLSQVELPVTIGLGKRTAVKSISVIWPGGSTQAVSDYHLDALTTVVESRPPTATPPGEPKKNALEASPPSTDPEESARAEVRALQKEEKTIATTLVESFPNDPGALRVLGLVHNACGEKAKALELWEKALRLAPGRSDLYVLAATLAQSQAHYEKAADFCRTGLAKSVPTSALYRGLATALISLGKPEEALLPLQSAVNVSPSDDESHQLLGKTCLMLNQYEKAKASYEAAIKLQPHNSSSHYGLAQASAKLGLDEQSKRSLELCQKVTAENMNAQRGIRGISHAVERERQILSVTCAESATVYSGQRRFEKGEELLRRAVALAPTNATFRTWLAALLVNMNRGQEAVAVYRELIALEPRNPAHYLALAGIEIRLRRFAEASTAAQKAQDLDPDNEKCRRMLQQCILLQFQTGK